MEYLKNERVLIFGLGILGGGSEAARWFYKKGAKIIITDKKTKKELLPSLKKLKNIKARYILGEHRQKDIDMANIIYFNPGVNYKSEWVEYARKKRKEIINDCYVFFKYAKGDIVAVTGTRGKTTTTTWIYKILNKIKKPVLLGGNQPEKSLFKILDKTKENSVSILELSSFQLEFYEKVLKAPKIAIITNLSNDHLNRYSNLEEYARIKAKIFQNQTENDYLILNYDNEWTDFFLNFKPKSQTYFVSLKKLPKNLKGSYLDRGILFIRDEEKIKFFNLQRFKEKYGDHNIYNLLFTFLAIFLYCKDKNIKFPNLKNFIFKLQSPTLRQEIIYQTKNFLIINDSSATTPQATISALKRFSHYRIILIIGGTDKNLDFQNLAKEIKKKIKPENLILINGSATKKLIEELRNIQYKIKKENIFENLKEAVSKALVQIKVYRLNESKTAINYLRKHGLDQHKSAILFSPASASFEKFKNEFDRGRKFNKIISYYIK